LIFWSSLFTSVICGCFSTAKVLLIGMLKMFNTAYLVISSIPFCERCTAHKVVDYANTLESEITVSPPSAMQVKSK